MSPSFFYAIISLSTLGAVSAIILYFIAQKFKVVEDPRVDQVEAALPGVNCGGCGFAGCRNFAEACVNTDNMSHLFCPVGGNDCMMKVAELLGKDAAAKEELIAVLRCNGSIQNRPRTNDYDSVRSCAVSALQYSGTTGCQYGCIGYGDCVNVCNFDAIYIDKETGLPTIDDDKCTACGACVRACPNTLIELRRKGPKGRRVFVRCRNNDKGGVARKNCLAACIGCGKCVTTCPFDAIRLSHNLAYINYELCKLCRKCVDVCPTKAIVEVNFPPKVQKIETKDEK